MRIQRKKQGNWRAKKRQWLSAKKKKKKKVLSSTPDDIQQTLLHLTHFPVPSTVNEEFVKKNVISRNISLVKRKKKCGTSHVHCSRVMLPWGRQSLAGSLSMSVPRSLMMVISSAAFRLSWEQKMAFRRYSVCWLCKSSRLFSWIKEIKNCCEQRWTF